MPGQNENNQLMEILVNPQEVVEIKEELAKKMLHVKPVFAVCSGGLHPGHVSKLVQMLGKDIIIQMGGGIHGHPSGTKAGARAARQVVEAVIKKIPLTKYSKNHKELEQALNHWKK